MTDMSPGDRVAELEQRVTDLELALDRANKWFGVMYGDMLALQLAAGKAMRGERDEANAIYRDVAANAKAFRQGVDKDG